MEVGKRNITSVRKKAKKMSNIEKDQEYRTDKNEL